MRVCVCVFAQLQHQFNQAFFPDLAVVPYRRVDDTVLLQLRTLSFEFSPDWFQFFDNGDTEVSLLMYKVFTVRSAVETSLIQLFHLTRF